MRRFLAFVTVMFLLLNASFEYRIHELDSRVRDLVELNTKSVEALTENMKCTAKLIGQVEALERKCRRLSED